MPDQTSPTEPGHSTWALISGRTVTWRQATEGWVVLATLSIVAGLASLLFRSARSLARRR